MSWNRKFPPLLHDCWGSITFTRIWYLIGKNFVDKNFRHLGNFRYFFPNFQPEIEGLLEKFSSPSKKFVTFTDKVFSDKVIKIFTGLVVLNLEYQPSIPIMNSPGIPQSRSTNQLNIEIRKNKIIWIKIRN